MDLSGVIFVALALGWAGYLIPRALRHHEDVAASRPVDSFSDTLRVLERTPSSMKALLAAPETTVPAKPVTAPASSTIGAAARRRRRVLGLLLLVTAATAVAAWFGYSRWWTSAVGGALVLGWLVLCRMMVRRVPAARPVRSAVPAAAQEPADEPPLEAGLEAPGLAIPVDDSDDGSLWDPLPLTLPTYVTKPAARRTVRTIDLTQADVTSSGHSAADSALAAEAAVPAETPEAEQRKAAGA